MIKKSYFKIVILFSITSLLALFAWDKLQVVFAPKERVLTYTIQCSVSQMEVEDVEQLVTSVIESEVANLPGIKHIHSTSYAHFSKVWFELNDISQEEEMKLRIHSLLREIYASLPRQCSFPRLIRGVVGDKSIPLHIYNLVLNQEIEKALPVLQKDLIIPLSAIKGISDVQIDGITRKMLQVKVIPSKLQQLGLTMEDVERLIYSQRGVKLLDRPRQDDQIKVYLDLSISSWQLLSDMPIIKKEGTLFYLRDVAHLKMIEMPQNQGYRINGHPCLKVTIYTGSDVNILEVNKKIERVTSSFSSNRSSVARLSLAKDRSVEVSRSLSSLMYRSFFSLIILLLLVLLSYRKVKYLWILFCGLAVNVLWSICFISLLDIQIHIFSVAGIAISFGMILDNAVVSLDHYRKYQNRSNFIAIVAASLTTILAISIVFLLPVSEQKNLVDFALIIMIMLGVSLVIAAYFTPAMFHLVGLDKEIETEKKRKGTFLMKRSYSLYRRLIFWISKKRRWVMIFMILLLGLPLHLIPPKIEGDGVFVKGYNQTLGSPLYNQTIRPVVNKCLGGFIYAFYTNVYEQNWSVETKEYCLEVSFYLPDGHQYKHLVSLVDELEKVIVQYPGYQKFETTISASLKGTIKVYYTAETFERCRKVKKALMLMALKRNGASWTIGGYGRQFTSGLAAKRRDYIIKVQGFPYKTLGYWANVIADSLRQNKRAIEINDNDRIGSFDLMKTVYVAVPNAQKLYNKGYSVAQWQRMVTYNHAPMYASSEIELGGEDIPVQFSMVSSVPFSFNRIQEGHFFTSSGNTFKSENAVQISKKQFATTINKNDRKYVRSVGFNYTGGQNFAERYLNKTMKKIEPLLPPGYQWSYTPVHEVEEKIEEGLAKGWLLCILFVEIFFVCAILFNSLRMPFWIIMTIPFSFIGILIPFVCFNLLFDQGGYVSFVFLGGLVVNATIFIVEQYRYELNKGRDQRTALLKSLWNKCFTILVTISSTIIGLLPFILDGQKLPFWYSFSVGTIGGLLFSIFVIFLFLPSLMCPKDHNR